MSAKVTMQDIADALGLSRNTVSKAINNTGIVADSTRELILRKAVEMGYRHFPDAVFAGITIPGASLPGQYPPGTSSAFSSIPAEKTEIALITASMPVNSHFAVTALDRMQQILSSQGYSLTIYRLLPEDMQLLRLPGSLNPSKIAAIFCVELFHYEYSRLLASLGLPLLFIDGPVCLGAEPPAADLILMENQDGIFSFLQLMASEGKKTVGFVGNMMHCRSFFERGSACIAAAGYFGFQPVQPYSILHYPPGKTPERMKDYTEELLALLKKMPALPQIFVCANDFLAINTISALRRMNVLCPEDIAVLGFDDSPESRFHFPALSTVHIHTQSIGRVAAEMLLSRIADRHLELRTTYVQTDLILRESTQVVRQHSAELPSHV